MFKNFFLIASRNFKKERMYSFINIFGLAIGMAACLLIYMWVSNELNYDRFHQNVERIYRVEKEINFKDVHMRIANSGGACGPALVNDYAEIDNFVRIDRSEVLIRDYQHVSRKQIVYFADNTIFDVFDFKLEEGDMQTALVQPQSVVLSRKNALKYLNTEDAVGKTLTVEWNNQTMDYQVTGILEEIPKQSHVHFDMLISISTYPPTQLSRWTGVLYTYVLLAEEVSAMQLETKLKETITKYIAQNARKYFPPNSDIHEIIKLKLKPLLDIHLYPTQRHEIEPQGSMTSVYMFSSIAIFILFIACINFMNLSTARANKRAKEVGIRKTVGANYHQLWGQFLGESSITAFVAMILAMLLIYICLPTFNVISGRDLSIQWFFKSWNWLSLIAVTLTTGLIAGLYPAFFLSAFKPVNVLKGSGRQRTVTSKFNLRKVAVAFQFFISISLIIGTLTVYGQMQFFLDMDLGFDKQNVLIITATGEQVQQNYEAYRNALLGDPRIKNVSASSNFPGEGDYFASLFRRDGSDDSYDLIFMYNDYDFIDLYRLEVLHGRSFSRSFSTDITKGVVLNQLAAREIGYSPGEAVGKRLFLMRRNQSQEFNIVGVVKDYYFKSLHREIQPLALVLNPSRIKYISVKIAPADVKGTIDFIQGTWERIFPGKLFEFHFLDDYLNHHYDNEVKMKNLFLIFAVLSVFVASLGLLGLAAFSAEERTKEIGIRKILGASSGNLILLLNKEFTKWVLAANVVAWPLAYWGMNRWLQSFPYRINQGIWTYVLSTALALIVALITISFQSIKAANTNPTDTLKYE